jgi:hypothetical protein
MDRIPLLCHLAGSRCAHQLYAWTVWRIPHPSIREDFLDETIWTAVKNALQNPQIIAQGIRSVARHNQSEDQSSLDHDKRALEQIRTEETRIVQAYRLRVLTTEQLATELEALRARKSLINSNNSKPASSGKTHSVLRSVEDYRRAIPGRLEALSWEQKRKILQHLLTKIIFEGDRVTITGRVSPGNNNTASQLSDRSVTSPIAGNVSGSSNTAKNSDIASTTSGCCALRVFKLPNPFYLLP